MIMAALVTALHAFPPNGVLNMKKVEVAYIPGAGFLTYAGLPLQRGQYDGHCFHASAECCSGSTMSQAKAEARAGAG